jgi:WD40 repeat protein
MLEVRFPDEVYAVAMTRDESLVVAGVGDGTVRVLQLPDLREVGVYRQHSAAVHAVHISPDGSLVATGSDDHTVRLWLRKGEQLEELMTLPHAGPMQSVSLGHRSMLMSVLVDGEHAVRVWRLDRLHDELAKFSLGWREPFVDGG